MKKSAKIKKKNNSVMEQKETTNTEGLNEKKENNDVPRIINNDTMDELEEMADKLEQTTDIAEKVRLHSELKRTTQEIKTIIDGLIEDVNNSKFENMEISSLPLDVIDPNEKFDLMEQLNFIENDMDDMDNEDNIITKIKIFSEIKRKCEMLKKMTNCGEMRTYYCN